MNGRIRDIYALLAALVLLLATLVGPEAVASMNAEASDFSTLEVRGE